MKSILLALLVLASCATSRVQDRTLVPAFQSAWPGVRADAARGGLTGLEAWDVAVETANVVQLRSLSVVDLESAALLGVDLQLVAGEIGPQGAAILRDRAATFRASVEEYTRVVLVKYVRRTRDPIVISSSSWAKSPPPAIARLVYR
tara:strand:- start:328 stop:768 length:441 start_codon:yes stop_codon:yes gene_type:complete